MNDSLYSVVREGETDELKHYGVLGMRWGIRHDRRVKYAKNRYKTIRKDTKRQKGITVAEKKKRIAVAKEDYMQERENAANRLYSLNSKKMNRTVARDSVGKTLAKTYLLGSAGAMQYDRSRANGHGRVVSGLAGLGYNAASQYTGRAIDNAEYLAQRSARKKKKGQKYTLYEKTVKGLSRD